jgi:hypothetical protein
MKETIYLFGYLLSCANKNGVVRTSYRDLSTRMDIPQRTLQGWMASLKKKGYVTVKKSMTMVITIHKFRSIKGSREMQNLPPDIAVSEDEISQVTTASENDLSRSTAKPCRSSPRHQPQDHAPENFNLGIDTRYRRAVCIDWSYH